MPDEFQYDVFLSHSAKDKAVLRPLAERLPVAVRKHLKAWFDRWEIPVASVYDRRSEERRSQSTATAARIEERLERSRVLVLCMSPHKFGSDWVQLEAGTCGRGNLPFRDPLNQERRFLPLRLDPAPSTFTELQDHRIKLNY